MTPRERVRAVFAHEQPDRVPMWCGASVEFWAKAVKLCKKSENPMREDREMLENTPRKIAAARKGLEPEVSPLGDKIMPDKDDIDDDVLLHRLGG